MDNMICESCDTGESIFHAISEAIKNGKTEEVRRLELEILNNQKIYPAFFAVFYEAGESEKEDIYKNAQLLFAD